MRVLYGSTKQRAKHEDNSTTACFRLRIYFLNDYVTRSQYLRRRVRLKLCAAFGIAPFDVLSTMLAGPRTPSRI